MTEQKNTPTPKRLCRDLSHKMIAGVAAGIADYLSVDPGIIRLLFVIMALFGGSGIPLYIILWIILPSSQSAETTDARETMEMNFAEIKQKAQAVTNNLAQTSKPNSSQSWFGVAVVLVGAFFLLNNYGIVRSVDIERLWPLVLILFGVYIISRNDK